jgi:uncharacterized protein HemY
MRRNTLLVDAAIALAVTALALILAPGLAVVGILALLVLLVCGVSFAVAGWRGRRARRHARRRHPPRSRRRLAR